MQPAAGLLRFVGYSSRNIPLCLCYNRPPKRDQAMFRERARLFNRLLLLVDILVTCSTFPLAYASRIHLAKALPWALDRFLNPELFPLNHYLWIVGLAAGWWAMAAFSLGLYRISIRRSGWEKIRIVFESSILLWLFLGVLSFALRLNLSRPLITLFVFYQALVLVLIRLPLVLKNKRGALVFSSSHSRNILIIGPSVKAREMGALISRYSDWGLSILGYIEPNEKSPYERTAPDTLGLIKDLPRIVENNVVDEIIIVGDSPTIEGLDEIFELCNEQGIRTRVAADFFPAKVTNVSMEFLENVPVISFSSAPEHAPSLFVKRVLDIVVSSILLLLLLPFFCIIALLVKLTSKGPVIYRQTRCGLYGRKFVLYKIRSMRNGAEDVLWEIKHLNEMDGPVFKMRNDPRVTPLGRFLRKSSIDEWPQFWNVLKGDMSLVGPRAPLPDEVKEYTRWQRRRLSVKPGITCLWQVSGRNEIDFHEWMKLDLHYIDNWSLLLDLKILLRTFPVVLFGKGAR
jgi:exopolysaccharide biosynthesis polyprenyl glycosylphosphotransferase